MTWMTATRTYTCFRCGGRIQSGTRYFRRSGNSRFPSGKKRYLYHPICKSLSGKKETRMTGPLRAFIKAVGQGPKLTAEIPVSPQAVNVCYRKAVMMGVEVYKHVFYSKRTKKVIFFMREHRSRCVSRVERLGKHTHDFNRQHTASIMGIRSS